MRYQRVAPWQCLTRFHDLRLTQRLPRVFDAAALRDECAAVLERYPRRPHFRDEKAGWDGIGLVAANGDPFEGRKLDAPYQKTEALALAPYTESIIDAFPCEKKRVRLLRLVRDHPVPWHFDVAETLDRGRARLHVPIETNSKVRGDSARVHLVIDLVLNESVAELFGDEPQRQAALRARVRPRAQALCRSLSEKPGHLRRKLRKRFAGRGRPASPSSSPSR
ncbi:MAG: hypothetical protein QNK04_22330 [Myxococcota bacterium]|nr:hypothetical protein [Myxococcota bacterium]